MKIDEEFYWFIRDQYIWLNGLMAVIKDAPTKEQWEIIKSNVNLVVNSPKILYYNGDSK